MGLYIYLISIFFFSKYLAIFSSFLLGLGDSSFNTQVSTVVLAQKNLLYVRCDITPIHQNFLATCKCSVEFKGNGYTLKGNNSDKEIFTSLLTGAGRSCCS